MKMHDLKTWPEYFDAIISGAKLFEVRKDDRGFTVGDTLLLREWDPKHSWYTGRTVSRRVTYVLTGPAFGIEAGFVCMGIIEAELSKQEPVAWQERQQLSIGGAWTNWYECPHRPIDSPRQSLLGGVGGIPIEWRPLYAAPLPEAPRAQCGCRQGECESRPAGCRMVIELQRPDCQ